MVTNSTSSLREVADCDGWRAECEDGDGPGAHMQMHTGDCPWAAGCMPLCPTQGEQEGVKEGGGARVYTFAPVTQCATS